MLVHNLCKQNNISIPYSIGARIGDGADGECFEINNSNKVIKLCVLFDYPNRNLKKDYDNIIKVINFIKNNNLHTYAKVYDYEYVGKFNRPNLSMSKGQDYILYYYVMEKLVELTDDEKRVFHSVLSHEDKGEAKNYEILKIKKMLEGMRRALDFDEEKVTFFCEELRRAPIMHNDIHIRNIMKDHLGNFKMIDFDRCFMEEYVF